MKTILLLFCFTVFSFTTFFTLGYKVATQDIQLYILNDPYAYKSLKHTCVNLTYTTPDYSQIYLGMKAICNEFEQESNR